MIANAHGKDVREGGNRGRKKLVEFVVILLNF